MMAEYSLMPFGLSVIMRSTMQKLYGGGACACVCVRVCVYLFIFVDLASV